MGPASNRTRRAALSYNCGRARPLRRRGSRRCCHVGHGLSRSRRSSAARCSSASSCSRCWAWATTATSATGGGIRRRLSTAATHAGGDFDRRRRMRRSRTHGTTRPTPTISIPTALGFRSAFVPHAGRGGRVLRRRRQDGASAGYAPIDVVRAGGAGRACRNVRHVLAVQAGLQAAALGQREHPQRDRRCRRRSTFRFPASAAGAGKVQLSMQNRIVEYQAVTDDDEPLKTGENVDRRRRSSNSDTVRVRACGTSNQRRGAAGRSTWRRAFNGTQIKLMQFACRTSAEGGDTMNAHPFLLAQTSRRCRAIGR